MAKIRVERHHYEYGGRRYVDYHIAKREFFNIWETLFNRCGRPIIFKHKEDALNFLDKYNSLK